MLARRGFAATRRSGSLCRQLQLSFTSRTGTTRRILYGEYFSGSYAAGGRSKSPVSVYLTAQPEHRFDGRSAEEHEVDQFAKTDRPEVCADQSALGVAAFGADRGVEL